MRRLVFTVIVSLSFLSACGGGGGGDVASLRKGDFTLTSPSAEVFARIDEFIYVEVTVNGVDGVFILDTGADAFVVSEDFADRANLAFRGQTSIVTIAGSSVTPLARIEEFRFANVVGVDIDAAVVDLVGLDGIVGVPFFRSVLLSIDYETGLLGIREAHSLSLQTEADASGGQVLSAEGFVLNGVRINGLPVGPLRIDTGSSGGIRISREVAAPLLSEADETLGVVSTASNGTVEGTAFIADVVDLGDYSLRQQFIVAQQAELGTGLIGSLVLRQFFVILDYSRGQVLLRQDRDFRYQLAARTLRISPYRAGVGALEQVAHRGASSDL